LNFSHLTLAANKLQDGTGTYIQDLNDNDVINCNLLTSIQVQTDSNVNPKNVQGYYPNSWGSIQGYKKYPNTNVVFQTSGTNGKATPLDIQTQYNKDPGLRIFHFTVSSTTYQVYISSTNDLCALTQAGTANGIVCQNGGTCVANQNVGNSCSCPSNRGLSDCSDCASGYYGPNCDACPICGSHGTCNNGDGGVVKCNCDKGWTGDLCDSCDSGYFGKSCTKCPDCGNGTCNEGEVGDTGSYSFFLSFFLSFLFLFNPFYDIYFL